MFMFYLLFLILLILSISFLTLFERLMISLSQNRLGPNKNSFIGLLQCIFDGLKILKKEFFFVENMNYLIFFSSFSFFGFTFLFYYLFYLNFLFNYWIFSIMIFMIFIGFMIYFNMFFSFLSKSKYPFLGFMRFNNQSISFEILFFFWMFILMNMNLCFNMKNMFNLLIFIMLIFIVLIFLTELNRSPFDFSEGESELVSGFNTEFLNLNFIFLFLGEYNMIIMFSYFLCLLFNLTSFFIFILVIFILIRSSYPRFRFDLLMSLFWLMLMPMILFFFFFIFIFLK